MDREDFLKSLAYFPIIAKTMNTNSLGKLVSSLNNTEKMPVLFLGHGSPMNAIEENDFVKGFRKVSGEIMKPNAVLCISAHWETRGTFVTAMEHPRTIHDFGGFPKELYEIQYPAPGSPELAKESQNLITKTKVEMDENWGLDHGAWSVIRHMYPDADVPVIQMSLDYTKPAQYHFDLAKEISSLRNKGILIVGSGNMVHNLRLVAWDKLSGDPYAFDWAVEAHEKMKNQILDENFKQLIDYKSQGKFFDLAVPTPEHYLPLLYALALKDKKEKIEIFNDQPVGGSLYMTSVKIS